MTLEQRKQKFKKEQATLKNVACSLGGGWVYNEFESGSGLHSLKNNSLRLVINVYKNYSDKIHQWRLGVKENRFLKLSIGCNIEKDVNNIVSDLKKRLLNEENMKQVLQIAQEIAQKEQDRAQAQELESYLMAAISQIKPLKKVFRYNGDAIRYDFKGGHIHGKRGEQSIIDGKINITLNNLAADQVIQILALLK